MDVKILVGKRVKELRNKLNINPRDSVEFWVDGETVVLKKYEPACVFCGDGKNMRMFQNKNVCLACLKKISNLKFKDNGTFSNAVFNYNVNNSLMKNITFDNVSDIVTGNNMKIFNDYKFCDNIRLNN